MKKLKRRTKWIIASVVIVLVMAVLYLLALFTPNSIYRKAALYPLWFIECGKQPVLASYFGETPTYYLPEDGGYGPNIFTDRYFCSETEARAAGFERTIHHK
ncbi:MAG TPA: hypothetical protein VFZ58_00780 [Candidatus Saccharimonadales bacterium]